MAKRGLKVRRWMIACGLVGFVLTSAAVIARRSYGQKQGLSITALQRRYASLESERVRLGAVIRNASSRPRLVSIAERRLGMHLPPDTQIVILRRQPRSGGTP